MPGVNNWLKHNIVPGDKTNLTKQFECSFELGTVKKMSINDAADYTADLISKTYTNLHLSFSGGLDSMFVANVLHRNKIPFKPIILDWYWLDPECWYAYDWCERHNIEPLVLTITPETEQSFLEKILTHALKLKTPAKIGYLPAILTEIIPDGKLITGFGEPFYNSESYYDTKSVGEIAVIGEHDYYLELIFDKFHPGGFLSYTPELFFSLVKNLPTGLNTQHAKAQIYGLEFRPKFNNINVLPWGKYQTLRDKLVKPYEKTITSYKKSDLLKLI